MSEMSEMELYRKLAHCVEEAENCARGLAQHRGDVRWFAIGQGLNMMRQQVQQLAIGRAINHTDSIRLLNQHELDKGNKAAKQRYAERVADANRSFRRGH